MARHLDMGMKCIKYMLLTVNLMFVLTATLIISVGTTIYAVYNDFDQFIDDTFYSPASLLIAIGIIMLAVSIFGCCGAAKESTCMINMFALLLSIVFVLEVAATIAAYNLQSGLYNLINSRLVYAKNNYDQNGEMHEAIDFLQSSLQCCGVDEPKDWINVSNNETDPNGHLPDSCCIFYNHNLPSNETYSCDLESEYLNTNGCMKRLTFLIGQSSILLGTGALTIAFIQFLGIIFAVMLGKAIRQAKSDRELRRWEIRERIINNSYTQLAPHQEKKPENATPVIYVPHLGIS